MHEAVTHFSRSSSSTLSNRLKNAYFRLIFLLFILLSKSINSQILTSTFSKVESNDSTYIAFFAEGNISGLATSNGNATPVGTGAIGINVQKRNSSWTARVSVATNVDTVIRGFGTHVLNPGAGSSLSGGFLDLRLKEVANVKRQKIGLHFYICTSKTYWGTRDTTISAITSGAGATMYFDIMNAVLDKNEIAFGFEMGLAYRWIAGDIASKLNNEIRQNLLGSKTRHFPGFQAGMQIQCGSLIAGIHGYWLFNLRSSEYIPGVTKGQLSAAFTISGPIFEGIIKSVKH